MVAKFESYGSLPCNDVEVVKSWNEHLISVRRKGQGMGIGIADVFTK